MITSSTSSGAMPARLTLSRTTIAPRSVAANPFNEPKNFPTGVLTALMITASLVSLINTPKNYLAVYDLLFTQEGVKQGNVKQTVSLRCYFTKRVNGDYGATAN
jgi:hypothetical protein